MKSKQTAAHTHSHKSVLTDTQTAFDKIQIIKRESKRKGEILDSMLNFLQLLHCNVTDELDKESSKIKMGTRWRFKINLYSQKHHRQPGLLAWCSCPICCQHFWQFTLAKLLHASLLCLSVTPLFPRWTGDGTQLRSQSTATNACFSLRLLLLQHVWCHKGNSLFLDVLFYPVCFWSSFFRSISSVDEVCLFLIKEF